MGKIKSQQCIEETRNIILKYTFEIYETVGYKLNSVGLYYKLVTNYYGDDDICLLETYKHYT
jgi:hypothetical protein